MTTEGLPKSRDPALNGVEADLQIVAHWSDAADAIGVRNRFPFLGVTRRDVSRAASRLALAEMRAAEQSEMIRETEIKNVVYDQ